MKNTVTLSHFSDILCIWAYISQIRMEELTNNHLDKLAITYYFYPVFGDALKKISKNWQGRGGLEAYNKHVVGLQKQFPHIKLHPDVWKTNGPHSSLPAHLYLCSIKRLENRQEIESGSLWKTTKAIRHAFFAENLDISSRTNLHAVLERGQLPIEKICTLIDSGEAYAELASDMALASANTVQSSPTVLLNENRQRLAGNVGYKILEANILELIEDSTERQSWC